MTKVISIPQPYASLMALGYKRIYTCDHATRYTGPVIIHANAKRSDAGRTLHHLAHEQFKLPMLPLFYDQLPFGADIGQVQLKGINDFHLYDSRLADHQAKEGNIFFITYQHYPACAWSWEMTAQELALGDYKKRFGWLTTDPIQFEKPIPADYVKPYAEYKNTIKLNL